MSFFRAGRYAAQPSLAAWAERRVEIGAAAARQVSSVPTEATAPRRAAGARAEAVGVQAQPAVWGLPRAARSRSFRVFARRARAAQEGAR